MASTDVSELHRNTKNCNEDDENSTVSILSPYAVFVQAELMSLPRLVGAVTYGVLVPYLICVLNYLLRQR